MMRGWRTQDPTLEAGRPLTNEEHQIFLDHQKYASRRNKVVTWSGGMGTLAVFFWTPGGHLVRRFGDIRKIPHNARDGWHIRVHEFNLYLLHALPGLLQRLSAKRSNHSMNVRPCFGRMAASVPGRRCREGGDDAGDFREDGHGAQDLEPAGFGAGEVALMSQGRVFWRRKPRGHSLNCAMPP